MRVLLFDFNNLLYKALAVMPPLIFHGKNVGGLYGFIQQICSKINLFKPDYIIVCNDKPPYLRKQIFKDYKKLRKAPHNRDEEKIKLTHESREYCLNFLKSVQIPILQQDGYEADDMIAKACEDLHNKVDEIIVISNDDDLFQIFQYSTNIYMQKNKVFYGVRNFLTDYPDLEPFQWPLYLALKGSHNGVPGLKGVGAKGAIRILKDKKEFERILNQEGDIIELYTRLATLPYDDELDTVQLEKSNYGNSTVKFFVSHGIELAGSMHKAFVQIGS